MPARPRVIFVVAHDRHGVMGAGGKLPWHLPADLKQFRTLTIGKPVVMGRKTYESIGKALPGRENIVLTRDPTFQAAAVEVAASPEAVWKLAAPAAEVAVIGGAQIFNAFAAYVDTAFVTEVDVNLDGDVFYTPPQRKHEISVLGEHPADERNAYAMVFLRYDYEQAAVTGGSTNESNPFP